MSEPSVLLVIQPVGEVGAKQTATLVDALDAVATVDVVAPPLETDLGVPTHTYRPSSFLSDQLAMARLIRRHDAEVVWFYGATAYLLPVAVARVLDRTVVTQPKGDVPLALRLNHDGPAAVGRAIQAVVSALNESSYQLSDAVVTYTPSMAAQYGLNGDDTLTDAARYVPDEYRVQTPMAARDPRVGFVGRHAADKNIHTVIDIAKTVDVPFEFAGTGPTLDTVASLFGHTDRVTVHGWVDDLPALLNRLQVLVLPSTPIEGLPTVMLEAMACGTPVMATPVSGVPDVITDGENGFLVDEPTAEAFTARVDAVLNSDDLPAVSQAAAATIEEAYRREHAIKRYDRLIDEVVA